MDQASTLLRVQRPQEVSAAQRIFLPGCSVLGERLRRGPRGGVRAPCAAAICQGVLKCFNTCTPGLATPGCAGYESALPLSAFGRGRCLGGAGLGGASYEQENQRGFWQFAWPPLYLSVNSRLRVTYRLQSPCAQGRRCPYKWPQQDLKDPTPEAELVAAGFCSSGAWFTCPFFRSPSCKDWPPLC